MNHALLVAVPGAPAYLGRQLRFSAAPSFSEGSGNSMTPCISIMRRTVSTMLGKASISQFAESAMVRYLCASSVSYFARLMCWASWSKHASMTLCNVAFGFLQSRRNSSEGSAGTLFMPRLRYRRWSGALRNVLVRQYKCQYLNYLTKTISTGDAL